MSAARILASHADQLLAQAIEIGRTGRFDLMQQIRGEAAIARRLADEARQTEARRSPRARAA